MECVFERNLYHKKNTILSLTTKPCDKPNNAIFINDNHRPERSPVNYTVCICGPTKYNYSDYQRVIEWMELNRILGAGRTIIYNVDTSRLVQSVFNYYRRRGELEVYNVNPPYIYGDQRWIKGKHEDPAYAKMSMRHDCIMREMFKTRYVVFLDLDENIVPRISDDYTWDDMIKSTGCENDDYIMAGNVHFRRNWGVDYMVKKDPEISFTYRLLTLMTTYRDEMFFPPMTRSKYMVKPETVAAASTHRAFLIGGLKQPCLLRTHIGALHHYKYRNNHINDTESVRDRTMFKYRDLLLENVARAYRDLRKDLELFDIFV
ncbi:hypothetical protein LSH36_213g03031 [Paralvinella palmiformis]|uniref:Glycosyltransferase family 92 protein n=1 Tax=Paralvinella palmiformis TaxID=53620 RepID=A0AAD9N449_9ANNE|nr:hypothetical protein LSH36_213g03031 [Paralvinella palmiformis]